MARQHVLAACLLVATCAGPTKGQTQGEASLSGLGYSLVDLDLSDSAAPSILFSIPEGAPTGILYGYAEASVWMSGPQHWESDYLNAFDANRGTSRSASVSGLLGHARADGLPGPGTAALEQSLSASWGSRGSGNHGGASVVAAAETLPIYFTLAPRTRVTFSATLGVQGNIDPATIRFEHLDASAYLAVFNLYAPYSDSASTDAYLQIDTRPDSERFIDETQRLSLSWDNPGDQPAYGAARMSLWGSSYTSSLIPVPEPAPPAMLLAGVLLLLLRARPAR